MNLDQVKLYIRAQTDKGLLQQIIQTAQLQLEQLEQPQEKGTIELRIHNNRWYALMPKKPGCKQAVIPLGPQLTPAAVFDRYRESPPAAADFEITAEEADRRRLSRSDYLGWWEEKNAATGVIRKRYYNVREYDRALSIYNKGRRLINDPLCLVYRLEPEAVEKIQAWQQEGYEIRLPE